MNKLFLLLLFSGVTLFLSAQSPMRVVHCKAVNQSAAVLNIHINESNDKWVGTKNALIQVHSADNGSRIELEDQQWSLLRQACGNHPIVLEESDLLSRDSTEGKIPISESNQISAAYYDDHSRELWVGTTNSGVFRFDLKGKASLIEYFDSENSKLKSNYINTIFIDQYGRTWIGTKEGVLMGKDNKWKIYDKRSNIQSITSIGPDVWIMGEDILWKADPKNRWIAGDVDLGLAQGKIKDICFDSEGRLWIASEVITRYDVVADKVEVFGPSKGFTSKNVSCIEIDRENALWVGTEDKGLFLIEKKSEMTVIVGVKDPLSCLDKASTASLQVRIIGGTPPYKYKWDKGLQGEQPKNLGEGLYQLTVTDSEGAVKVTSAKVDRPKIILALSEEKMESEEGKSDGSASVVADRTGSINEPNYQYRWDNGETTATAVSLKSGEHSITVSDEVGCTTIDKITINLAPTPEPEPEEVVAEEPVEVIEPLKVVLTQTARNFCPDAREAALRVDVEGGKAPFKYRWTPERYVGDQISELGIGTYSLTVTDAADNSQSANITIKAPEAVTATVRQIRPASRDRARDGTAEVKAEGGTPGFTYLWDNGETTANPRRLNNGNHSVTITDAKGCNITKEVTIAIRQLPELDASTVTSGQVIQLQNLYFQADSANIETPSKPVLDEVYNFLKNNPEIVIEVGGHTNNIPDHKYCDRLSSSRAQAVALYIIDQGIDGKRVAFKGYGKRKPIASNKSAAGRRKNQRVEIKILSMGGNG